MSSARLRLRVFTQPGPEADLVIERQTSKASYMTQLHEQLEKVTDEATFLAFVQALIADRRGNAEHWENRSIEEFLEAASAWAADSAFGTQQGLSLTSPWRKFATFLHSGKIYE
ncbi:MAG: hypothetical protein Q7T55_24165 [Solirubrobacteraceae bacterium]|nr:hypothetical protein [Solirubrobacteraceae bacterium]